MFQIRIVVAHRFLHILPYSHLCLLRCLIISTPTHFVLNSLCGRLHEAKITQPMQCTGYLLLWWWVECSLEKTATLLLSCFASSCNLHNEPFCLQLGYHILPLFFFLGVSSTAIIRPPCAKDLSSPRKVVDPGLLTSAPCAVQMSLRAFGGK